MYIDTLGCKATKVDHSRSFSCPNRTWLIFDLPDLQVAFPRFVLNFEIFEEVHASFRVEMHTHWFRACVFIAWGDVGVLLAFGVPNVGHMLS